MQVAGLGGVFKEKVCIRVSAQRSRCTRPGGTSCCGSPGRSIGVTVFHCPPATPSSLKTSSRSAGRRYPGHRAGQGRGAPAARGRPGLIYFVDCEASSLFPGSFPVEVAWTDQDGRSESYLIRPADEWLDEARDHPNWSQESERVHGISLTTLLAEGLPHRQVALRVEEVLTRAGLMVCSDAPSYDGMWLDRLFSAADLRSFVRLVGVHELYRLTCREPLEALPPGDRASDEAARERVIARAREIIAEAEKAEASRSQVRHRARPDAEGLWWT